MRIEYHPEAEKEIIDSINYLREKSVSASESLAAEIVEAIEMIVQFPFGAPQLTSVTRRRLLPGKTHALIYSVDDQVVYVAAFAHVARRPKYWLKRLK